METLNILSAGAAQAVVARAAEAFQRELAGHCTAAFGGVHAVKARLLAGEPADVIILTDELIDELIDCRLVVSGSRVDLGTVATGVAVRAGAPVPDVSSAAALRSTLLSASAIIAPDPQLATAGRVLREALRELSIADSVEACLVWVDSGSAAMRRLATGSASGEIGVVQMTEIQTMPGVCLAGRLPDEFQRLSVYSAGVATASSNPARSNEFIRRLKDLSSQMQAEGFGAHP